MTTLVLQFTSVVLLLEETLELVTRLVMIVVLKLQEVQQTVVPHGMALLLYSSVMTKELQLQHHRSVVMTQKITL